MESTNKNEQTAISFIPFLGGGKNLHLVLKNGEFHHELPKDEAGNLP